MLQLAGFVLAHMKNPQAKACATKNKAARPRTFASVPLKTDDEFAD
jgi:hypothetical protein